MLVRWLRLLHLLLLLLLQSRSMLWGTLQKMENGTQPGMGLR
jgi:hypothetical protein